MLTRAVAGSMLVVTGASCGGPAFTAAEADSGTSDGALSADSGARDGDGTGAAEAAIEGGPGDSGASDAVTSDTSSDTGSPGTCAPLPSDAKNVYVDQTFTGATRTGAPACPYSNIQQGLAAAAGLSGTRTVHVAGSDSGLVYRETGPVTIGPGIILEGDGPAQTTISASGTCANTTCAVVVEGGGVLDGFTVISTAGEGIITLSSTPAPVVKNVSASGGPNNGIVVLGAVMLGPNVTANNNGNAGVQSPASAVGVLHVVGTSNSFNGNTGNGINLDGAAALTFEGGTANGNGLQGIRLAGTSGSGGHTITSLTATGNRGPAGVVAYGAQTLKIRSSVLIGNANVGLFYNYGSGATLDLGTGASDPGGNTFGSVTAAARNGKAGIRLCSTSGAAVQVADGNLWSSCPPTETAVACSTAIGSYTDVAYGFTVSTVSPPVVATTCTTGP